MKAGDQSHQDETGQITERNNQDVTVDEEAGDEDVTQNEANSDRQSVISKSQRDVEGEREDDDLSGGDTDDKERRANNLKDRGIA